MMPKKDGTWCLCDDFRCLNTITFPERYPLPNIMDLSANMEGCTIFSKEDLVKAFHQVPIALEDCQKTAIITLFWLFEYNYMPFGLCNAAQTLQRMQDQILKDLPCTFVYLDDQHVASRDMEQHVADLRAVFQCLKDNGLAINLELMARPFAVQVRGAGTGFPGTSPLHCRHHTALRQSPGDV
jgi:hypothetical protein